MKSRFSPWLILFATSSFQATPSGSTQSRDSQGLTLSTVTSASNFTLTPPSTLHNPSEITDDTSASVNDRLPPSPFTIKTAVSGITFDAYGWDSPLGMGIGEFRKHLRSALDTITNEMLTRGISTPIPGNRFQWSKRIGPHFLVLDVSGPHEYQMSYFELDEILQLTLAFSTYWAYSDKRYIGSFRFAFRNDYRPPNEDCLGSFKIVLGNGLETAANKTA